MSFLNNVFDQTVADKRLLGNWGSDLNDKVTSSEIGNVKISFDNNGKLTYAIKEIGKNQLIYMSYIVKDNVIITNQPAHPKKEETEFYFEDDRILILMFNGIKTRFIKEYN